VIARLWRYIKIAKFAYLGWWLAFIFALMSSEVVKGAAWWWGQAGVLLFITILVNGVLWFMEAKYGRRPEK